MSRDPVRLTATPSQTVGPFFHFGLAADPSLGDLATADTGGTRIRLRVRVIDGDSEPVPDALVEIWQADAHGAYVRPAAGSSVLTPKGFCGFGRLPTAADGFCVFHTILPGRVTDPGGTLQAPHINVCLLARGLLRQIYTRIYFAGTPGLETDAVLALVPADRRATLMARKVGDEWAFEIHLQGEHETVFFDL
jgi:protocatechuate 3,4-dioxygenase alpha subunit